MNDDVRMDATRRALSRRLFLRSVTGLAISSGMLAGCGGGGGGTDADELRDATFRGRDDSRNVAVSITVDEDGQLTFWTLLAAEREADRFADFGQAVLDDNGFEVVSTPDAGNVRTYGDIARNRISGRTEDASNSGFGYSWDASRVGRPDGNAPPERFTGTFTGEARINNVAVTALLSVSRDGNATFFGAFDDLANNDAQRPDLDVDFYGFESLSFNGVGDGYDYFLNFYGDTLALRDFSGGGLSLLYTFADDDPDLGNLAGVTFNIPLTRGVGRSSRATRSVVPKGAPGLNRAVRALRGK